MLFSDYEQLKRFFYLFMFRDPAGFAEAVVARDEMAFLDKLWADWSPGFQPGDHLARVKACLRQPGQPGCRARLLPGGGSNRAGQRQPPARYAAEQQAAGRQARSPRCTCTGPAMAASAWHWPAAPNASSPRPRAWS